MAPKRRINFSGRERASKYRRMGKVDREQQAEIDQLQELFLPDPQWYAFYSGIAVRPNIYGTHGTANGPQVLYPFDHITYGTAANQRLGQEITVQNFQVDESIRWNAYYQEAGDIFPIIDQRVRVDYLWVRNVYTTQTFTPSIPDLWRIKSVSLSSSVYAIENYMKGFGHNRVDVNTIKDAVRWAKTEIIRPPSTVTHRPWPLADFQSMVYGNVAGANPGATATTPAYDSSGYVKRGTESHLATTTKHTFRFPLPPNYKVQYAVDAASNADVGHCSNEWLPVIFISSYLEVSRNNGDTEHIEDNNDVGQPVVEQFQMIVNFRTN